MWEAVLEVGVVVMAALGWVLVIRECWSPMTVPKAKRKRKR